MNIDICGVDKQAAHFALFLTGCCNAMSDMEYMEELHNAASIMTAIITELAYKLREGFRSTAMTSKRSTIKDPVEFVKQASKDCITAIVCENQRHLPIQRAS